MSEVAEGCRMLFDLLRGGRYMMGGTSCWAGGRASIKTIVKHIQYQRHRAALI